MTTKLGRLVTYHDGVSPLKSHDPLITLFCEITWQIKLIISPLTQCLSTPNLVRCWRGAYHLSQWLFDHVTNLRTDGTLKYHYLRNTHCNLAGCWQQGIASASKRLSRHRPLVKRKRNKTCKAVCKQIQFQCY